MAQSSIAIAGLGVTDVGKVYGRTSAQFAAEAVRLAAADAGVGLDEIDGLLVSGGISGGVHTSLAGDLGLRNLGLLAEVQAFGSTAGVMVQIAAQAITTGAAEVVACTFGDAPLRAVGNAGDAYARVGQDEDGFTSLLVAAGIRGANSRYALAARRHMEHFGTTSEQLGQVAVSTRQWARLNPIAQMQADMSIDDHQGSRMIADPLRLFDCCLVSNGGAAVIVTSAARAADLRQPAVHVLAGAQCHNSYALERESDFGLVTGAQRSGAVAMARAGVTPADIDLCEVYDCYTYTVVVTLEDYGFCPKGAGGEFVASGALSPGGALPTNTGGGQLSGYYLWGMTPLSEAVVQVRGHGGARQVTPHDLAIVSGNGGLLEYHSTLVLGSDRP